MTPEYLAAMKLVAGRGKDELDLETMLEGGLVDVAAATALIKRLLGAYAAKEFSSRVDLVEWKKSRR